MAALIALTISACVTVALGQGSLNELMTLQALDIDIPESAIRNAITGRQGGGGGILIRRGGQSNLGLGLGRQSRLPQLHASGFASQQSQHPVGNVGHNIGLSQQQLPAANTGLFGNTGLGAGANAGFSQLAPQTNVIGQSQGLNTGIGQQQGLNDGLNMQHQPAFNRFSAPGGSQVGGLAGSQIGGLSGSQLGQNRFASTSIGRFSGAQNSASLQGPRNQFQRGFGGVRSRGLQGNTRMFRG